MKSLVGGKQRVYKKHIKLVIKQCKIFQHLSRASLTRSGTWNLINVVDTQCERDSTCL